MPSPLRICLSSKDMNHSASLSFIPHYIFAHRNRARLPSTLGHRAGPCFPGLLWRTPDQRVDLCLPLRHWVCSCLLFPGPRQQVLDWHQDLFCYLCFCVYVHTGTCRSQKKTGDFVLLELQAVVSHLVWVLRTQVLWKSTKCL